MTLVFSPRVCLADGSPFLASSASVFKRREVPEAEKGPWSCGAQKGESGDKVGK